MEIKFINQLLKLMEKVMEWLQELYEAARQGGFPPFSLLPQKTAMELTTAHTGLPAWDDGAIKREYQRMLTRNRVRRCRERKKLKATAATAGEPQAATGNENLNACNAETITGNAKNVTCNGETVTGNGVTAPEETVQARMEPAAASAAVSENGNASVTACNAPVTPGNVFAKKEKETEKRKNQRKEINKNKKIKTNIADAMPKSARAHTHEEWSETAGLFAETHYTAAETQTVENNTTTEGSCLPFQPPEKKPQVLIPTAELPDVYRKIVSAWNKLPLPKKLSGLFPSLVKRLRFLLENYGEEQVHNAIASISDSPFLLGNSKNNRGWVVSLHWFLDPEHFEKILGGEYHDKKNSGGSGFFEMGDELKPLPEGFMGTVVY